MKIAKKYIMPMVVAILSLIIMTISINGFSIMSLFSPVDGKSDFQLSDIYTKVANRRGVSYCSDRVLVVASDNCNREELVGMIDVLETMHPAAIGIDINFQYPGHDDSYMLSLFDECHNLALPLIVSYDEENDVFVKDEWANSFLTEWLEEDKFSVVNLERYTTWGPVRSFRPFYTVNDDQIPAFSVRLASLADKEATDAFINRGLESEYINFTSRIVEVITHDDIFAEDGTVKPNIAEKVENRVVIVGDINNSKDLFPVPHEDKMPGVIIHAHCVDTILEGNYIDSFPEWLNILLSVLLCYLFMLLHILVEKYVNNGVDFIIRVVQVLMMFVLYKVGCTLYVHNYYVDVSLVLLMIASTAFVLDICSGIEHFGKYLIKKLKSIKLQRANK